MTKSYAPSLGAVYAKDGMGAVHAMEELLSV